MTRWEQLTGLFASITRSRMRDLKAIFVGPISPSGSAVPRCVGCIAMAAGASRLLVVRGPSCVLVSPLSSSKIRRPSVVVGA